MSELTDVQIALWRDGIIAMFVFAFMYGTGVFVFVCVTRSTRPTWLSLPKPPPRDRAADYEADAVIARLDELLNASAQDDTEY